MFKGFFRCSHFMVMLTIHAFLKMGNVRLRGYKGVMEPKFDHMLVDSRVQALTYQVTCCLLSHTTWGPLYIVQPSWACRPHRVASKEVMPVKV